MQLGLIRKNSLDRQETGVNLTLLSSAFWTENFPILEVLVARTSTPWGRLLLILWVLNYSKFS